MGSEMCIRDSFKTVSVDLCESLARTARRLCSEYVDPNGISALVACRLIALDKCPGVRPIGVGETARRVIGKAIATATGNGIQEAAGPLRVCAGHLSGCEVVVHAMHHVFHSSNTEAVILVDACNAFNSLNRETALQIKQVWFADDATTGGALTGLRKWWDLIVKRGPANGYFPNPTKTCLVVKEESAAMAKEVFQGTGISVTEEGKDT